MDTMDIEILGPFGVRAGGQQVAPSASKPRAMLALLASNADHTVPVEALIEELWGEDVPRSATNTLQTYVMQVRNRISTALARAGGQVAAAAAKSVLASHARGYELVTSGGGSDLLAYERLAEAGQRAAEAGDWAGARRDLRAALGLWRGPALAGVKTGPLLGAQVVRLEESRLSLRVTVLDAELRLGNHHRVLAELAELAAAHPLHELLQALYMLALYRTGRRELALRAYRQLRAALGERLGLDPLDGTRRLYRAMLHSVRDPELDLAPLLAFDLELT
jgi:SARP family transcriptional regulator, regulator of embCAB operon